MNTFAIYDNKNSNIIFNGTYNVKATPIDEEACKLFENEAVYVLVTIGDFEFKSEVFTYTPEVIKATLLPPNMPLTDIEKYTIAKFQIFSLENTLLQSETIDNYLTMEYDCTTSFSDIRVIYYTNGKIELTLHPYNLALSMGDKFHIRVLYDLMEGGPNYELIDLTFDATHPDWNEVDNFSKWDAYTFVGETTEAMITDIFLATLYRLWLEVVVDHTINEHQIFVERSGNRILDTNSYKTIEVLRENITWLVPNNWVAVTESVVVEPEESGLLVTIVPSNVSAFTLPYEYFEVELCVTHIEMEEELCLARIEDIAVIKSSYHFLCDDARDPESSELCNRMRNDAFLHPNIYSMNMFFSTISIDSATGELIYHESFDCEVAIHPYCYEDASVRIYERVAAIEIPFVKACTDERQNKVIELKYGEGGKLAKERFLFPLESDRYDIILEEYESNAIRQQILDDPSVITLLIENREHAIGFLSCNIRKDPYYSGLYLFLSGVVICFVVNISYFCALRKKDRQ